MVKCLFGKNQLERSVHLPYGKLRWLAGKWSLFEDVFPIESGDFPAIAMLDYWSVSFGNCWRSTAYLLKRGGFVRYLSIPYCKGSQGNITGCW